MDFYNEAIKNRYLETIDNEGTRTVVSYIFVASKSTEQILGKDLYNFSVDQIVLVLKNMLTTTVNTARANMINIRSYISWSIKNGYRDDNLNPLKGLGSEWASQFVDRTKKIHYSLDELIDLLEQLPNAQDQAFLALLFEGVNLDELREIHYNDINWNNNEIKLRKRNDEILQFNDRFMRYIKNAYEATIYRFYQLETGDYKEKELLPSDYLFKTVKSPRASEGDKPVNKSVFYTRMNNIKEEFDLEYLTPNALKQSGMIKMAADLYKEKGKMEYEEFEVIGDKYKSSRIKSNGYEYYNTTLMKEYINPEKLKELYDIDAEF